MKKFTDFILTLAIMIIVNLNLVAQGDCVIVIQGTRADAKEAFFKNSADNFVTAMGAMSPAPTITVLRPAGESSMLGGSPPRTESNYANKPDLMNQIRAALCKEECKDVIITLIGHGMGGNGINMPPPDKDSGGMKIGVGNTNNDYLLAADVAALIDSCKKSVKIIASECFAESMINGICKVILNKGLIGVAIGSSLWNEKSIGTGSSDANMTYEFLMNFLKNYYLIIGNPNAMADIIKAAAELKKKNEEYNAKIAVENAAREQKINDCAKMLDDMKNQLADLQKKIDDANAKIKNAEDANKLLKERKELEIKYNEANNKNKKEIKKELDKNKEELKKLGIKSLPSGKLDKVLTGLDAEIAKQDQVIIDSNAALVTLNADWMKLRNQIIDKEFELEKLKNTPPKSPIPDHLPVMELVIHEAFKSAKALTKSSTGVEPVTPTSTGPVNLPKTPPTDVKIGDNYFVYYKVIDKVTGKCVVVGYRRDVRGNPIGPIKSIECEIDCSKIKFSYNDGGTDKVVEATRQTDNSYKYTQDGQQVSNVIPGYKKMDLILPGQLLAEAYCQVVFNTIPDILVPNYQVLQTNYDADASLLHFNLLNGTMTHQVSMQFMPHEDVMITIDQSPPYLSSSTKRFTLINELANSFGKLGIINNDGQLIGNVQLCTGEQPLLVNGQLVSDLFRFVLGGQNNTQSFQLSPMINNPSLMNYNYNGNQGIIQEDNQTEPSIGLVQLTNASNGHNFLQWQYNNNHLSEVDNEMFTSTTIIAYDQGEFQREYSVSKEQNFWEDPFPNPQQTLSYKIYPVVANNVYCVAYQGILFDEFGMPTCMPNQVINNLNTSNRNRAKEKALETIFAYPNPFNESSELHFSMENAQQLILKIFSPAGDLIMDKMINSIKGWNLLSITKQDLPKSGLYFYTLKHGEKLFNGKLIRIE